MRIEKSDRRLLMWLGLAVLPLIITTAILSQEEAESGIPSTYSAQSNGAKAAFLLLQDLGYKAQRWERPPAELPPGNARTLLLLASPFRIPTPEEKNALLQFVSRGGRVLITGGNPGLFLPHAETEREPLPAPAWREYKPQQLTRLSRGGDIRMSPLAYWRRDDAGTLAHYADDGRPIVVSGKIGEGEIIWWAASTPLTNAGISKSGNLALLLNSIGTPADTEVLWDEHFHGYSQEFSGYMSQPSLRFGLLQAALVFAALLFTFSRRNGPVYPLAAPSRLSPLEFVNMLGKLYERARATHSALQVPYDRFRTQAARRLGLAPNVTPSELAQAIMARLRYRDDSLGGLLAEIEAALRAPELTEERALELAQQLSFHANKLKLLPSDQQETISHADSVPGAYARTN